MQRGYRIVLSTILLLLGVNAVIAGYGFIGTPDGSAVGIPLEWLEDSPFADYHIPGVLLFGLGCLHLIAGVLVILWREQATVLAMLAGVGMIIWIVTQAAMMGSFRHPAQTVLQLVCLTLGCVIVVMCLRMIRTIRRTDLPVRREAKKL